MNAKEEECHQRGDSDDEIAELRFQALLTKRENEAEISPAREPCPFNDNAPKVSINQPLSDFRGQPQYNFRGRGRGPYYKPYLQTFSQQIASKSVNSSNIVVLTSSEPEEERQAYQPPPDWIPERGGFAAGWGGRWPRGGRGVAPSRRNPGIGTQQSAPPLILPQDKYANVAKDSKEQNEQNKAKLSARMRRLQGSDSDSEDSESDSSDDSSSSDSSSDSNSSSSDSSSSDSDSESESNQEASSKASDKVIKKDKAKTKGEAPQHTPKVASSASAPETNGSSSKVPSYPTNAQSKTKSPVKVAAPPPSQLQASSEHKKSTFSPPSVRKGSSRSPSFRDKHSPPPTRHFRSRSPSYKSKRSSHSPQESYSHRPRLSPRKRKSSSFSPRRYSRSPRHSRTPIRRYGSRSPYRTHKGKSPIRRSPYGRYSKSPIPKKFSKSPGRFRSRSKSPYLSKKYRSRSRSPFLRKSRSPFSRKLSRSPLPRKLSRSPLPHRRSRSPLPGRLKSKSPFSSKRFVSRSPKPLKRFSSITPPPSSKPYSSRSPYGGRRYGSPLRSYSRRSSSFSPKRYRGSSPRGARPLYKEYRSKSPRPLSQGSPRRGTSFTPPSQKYGSRSPIRGRALSPEKRPFRKTKTPSPRRIKRIGSITPPPFSPRDKFPQGRPQSPFKSYGSRSPISAKYDPPLRRGLSPPPKLPRHLLEASEHPNDRGLLQSAPFTRSFSPRGHNYTNRSPSPYFRGRRTPPVDMLPISERGPPIPKSPIYYGSRPDMFSGRGNTADPYNQNHPPLPKRYPLPNPNDQQHPQWLPHKPELPLPHRQPVLSHYPPKFPPVEASYGNRGDFLPPLAQQLPEKSWPPSAPPNRNFGGDNYGPPHVNERVHLRSERFPPNGPQYPVVGGRGRGPRGQRGHAIRGVHLRLGGRGSWPAPQQGGPPSAHELPPFGDPYPREKPGRLGPPNLMKRPPPLYEPVPLLTSPLMHKTNSPGPQRIPRGPKTPPYSPNREPSPLEWQKRGQRSLKDRTPSLSPSPSPGYGNEPHPSRQLNPNIKSLRGRDGGRTMDSFEGPSNPRQGRYNTHKYGYEPPHIFKSDQRSDFRESVEHRKVLKGEEHKEKDIGFRKMLSSGRGRSVETDSRAPKWENDREGENKHRSPHHSKSKSSNESRSQSDYKEDSRSNRSLSDYKEDSRSNRSQSDYKEDSRSNRSQSDYKEDSRSNRSQSDYKEDLRTNRSQSDFKEDPRNIRSQPDYKEDSRSSRSQSDYKEESRSSRSQSDYKEDSRNKPKREREPEPDSKERRMKEIEDIKKREKEEREEKRVDERNNNNEQKPRSNEPKLKREREREPEKKENRDSKTKGDEFEVSSERNSEKDQPSSQNDLDRKRDRGGSSTRRQLKETRLSNEKSTLEDGKVTKGGGDMTKNKKELESKKEELSDDGSKKKKRKKKHKEEDKSGKSGKKKKKEKKKKKVSKKKAKKGNRDSDSEVSSKAKKKQEDSRNDSKERDLRQMLTKRGESPRDGGVKRHLDPLTADDKTDERKKRREDAREASKDWKLSSKEKQPRLDRGDRAAEESRGRDDRAPFRERERRLMDRRDRPEDGKRGSKGLMVTVGSGASNRQVTSGNGSNNFKGNSKKENPRIPVHLRLGPGSADNASDESSGSKVPKKGRPMNDGRRRAYAGGNVSGPRRPGSKGSRGNDR